MFWPDPTYQPTHPPTHQTIHPPMSGEFFTDFKSSNGIEISWLVQVLSNFYWFRGCPWWWWMGVGVGMGCGGVLCIHTCTCIHACMHMHVKHAKHACLHVGSHLQFLYMCVCVCMCMYANASAYTPMPPDIPHPPAPPQSHREPKTPKFNKSWTNWDISILFEDALPLNTPELI